MVGRGEGDGVGGFAVVAAEDEGLILVIDDQGEGGHLSAVYQIAGRLAFGQRCRVEKICFLAYDYSIKGAGVFPNRGVSWHPPGLMSSIFDCSVNVFAF